MMGIETGWYWRLCWRFITPGLMTAVLIYMLLDMSALTYKGVAYPTLAHGMLGLPRLSLAFIKTAFALLYFHFPPKVFGCFLAAFGLIQLPGWACYAIYKQRRQQGSFWQVSFPPPCCFSAIFTPFIR